MKLLRFSSKLLFGLLFIPLLFVQGQEPKEITITQLISKCRKDASSNKLDERRKAFEGLYQLSRNIDPAALSLMLGPVDPDPQIRDYAVRALANLGHHGLVAAPQLKRMLEKEKDDELRAKAAAALGAVLAGSGSIADEPDINEAILALARALREDPSALVRQQACIAIGRIGCGAKDAMGDLIDAMLKKESDPKLSELARNAVFGMAGPGCADYAPRLLEIYRKGDVDEPTQFIVLCVLGQIAAKEDEVVPLLVGVLKSNDASKKRLREAAAYGLCAMRAKAKNGVPALVDAFEASLKANDGHSLNLRQNILDGLPKLGADAKNAVPALTVALEGTLKTNDERSSGLRRSIFNVLGRLGPVAIAAAPTLKKIAGDPSNSPAIRKSAMQALKTIEKPRK